MELNSNDIRAIAYSRALRQYRKRDCIALAPCIAVLVTPCILDNINITLAAIAFVVAWVLPQPFLLRREAKRQIKIINSEIGVRK